MNLNDYQRKALTTDVFDSKNTKVTDPAFVAKILGLVGEAGEAAERFKKIIRDKDGIVDDADRQLIIKELGDVLWYVATLSHYLGEDLETVGQVNLDKLADRQKRGVLKSQGDER